MKHKTVVFFGCSISIDIPDTIFNWLIDRWPTSQPCDGAKPILVRKDVLTWDERAKSAEITIFDRIVQVQQSETGFNLRFNAARLQLSIDKESTTILLAGNDDDLRPLLLLALMEAFRSDGLMPFHAAAIAREGRCAILMAPSKTGKSTTLVTAALAGYTPVAEDMVWVNPQTLDVYSNDVQIRLWPDSLERFKAIFPTATRRDSDGKYIVQLNALPGYPPGDCKLDRFIVLKRDLSQPSFWHSPPQLELVRAAWEASGRSLITRSQHFAESGIQTLISTVPFKGLTIGNTPLDFTPLFE